MGKLYALLVGGIGLFMIIMSLKTENIVMMGVVSFIIGYFAGKIERPF